MGLDITFCRMKKVACPHCGKPLEPKLDDSCSSGGRVWYPFLESIGYYVPYDQRTEENDWYGKDMELTTEQAKEAYLFIQEHDVYDGNEIAGMIAMALLEGDSVAVNADW